MSLTTVMSWSSASGSAAGGVVLALFMASLMYSAMKL